MSSTALKILSLITLLVAIVLGYVAYRMSQGVSHPPQATAQTGAEGQQPTKMAVVAIKPITAFTAVPADAVALVPVAVLPDQYYTRIEEVVGRAPLADIATGTTVTSRFFRESNSLVSSIPPGFQAMSIEINDVIAVGGFVRPGDQVDVLLYIRSSGNEVQDSQSRILLRDTRVLAYEERVINEVAPQDNSAAQQQKQVQRRIRTAVIAVPDADTTRVMLGASLGELRLSLRPAPIEQTAGAEGGAAASQPIGTVGAQVPVATNQAPAGQSGSPVSVYDMPAEMPPVSGKPADEKVITLRELAGLKKKQASTPGAPPPTPAVIIYRGSKVETVSN